MAKFKGKCESDYLMESKRVYEKYIQSEKACKAELQEIDSLNGTQRELSSSAKQKTVDQVGQKISMRRADMKGALRDLEESFANMVYDFADLDGVGLSKQLVTALNSGINYTQQELLYLAKKAGNDQADARLLHDYAKSQGYDLHNYTSPEEKIARYHDMNNRLVRSADDENNQVFMRLPDDGVYPLIDKYWKNTEIKVEDMEICNTPKTLEEKIDRDLKERKEAEEANIDDEAFLEGFGAEKPKTEPEYYEPDGKDENGEIEYP